jgi:hypothetical protein
MFVLGWWMAASATEPAAPPPYSLPWQLRPVTVGKVIRSDTSLALYDPGVQSATVASTLGVSWALSPHFAPILRGALVHDTAGEEPAGTALVNPLVGGTYAVKLEPLQLAGFLGVTLPVGTGGGLQADPATTAAIGRGIAARSGMDNALFAVNYTTFVAGADAALLSEGATLQAEVTVLQLLHVRGPSEEDPRKTNLTAGLHAGYALRPWLSVGGELRHQRWLSTPAAVEADPSLRDTTTAAVGPRLHLRVDELRLRPGVSYAVPMDAPLSQARYHLLQLDLPVVF